MADAITPIAAILDRMIREKEVASAYYTRISDKLEDVEQRRWFRRLGQDEKDQRKILVKHRKEICGAPGEGARSVEISEIHVSLKEFGRGTEVVFIDALRLATRTADYEARFANQASDVVGDRSCRIFLKILGGESTGLRQELLTELRRLERAAESAA